MQIINSFAELWTDKNCSSKKTVVTSLAILSIIVDFDW